MTVNALHQLVLRSNNQMLYEFFSSREAIELTEDEIETCLCLMKENIEICESKMDMDKSASRESDSTTCNSQGTFIQPTPFVHDKREERETTFVFNTGSTSIYATNERTERNSLQVCSF